MLHEDLNLALQGLDFLGLALELVHVFWQGAEALLLALALLEHLNHVLGSTPITAPVDSVEQSNGSQNHQKDTHHDQGQLVIGEKGGDCHEVEWNQEKYGCSGE